MTRLRIHHLACSLVMTLLLDFSGVSVARADTVEQPPLELVKKRKKGADADEESEEAEPEKPRKKKSSGGGGARSSNAGAEKSVFSYISGAFKFGKPEVHPRVDENMLVVWLVGSLLVGVGGHIWMPMVMYKDVPDSPAKQNALILGVIATILWWVPGVFPFLFPLIYVYTLGLWLFLAWWAVVCAYVMPRAIADAYSDAYGGGGGGGGGGKKKRASSDDDD